MTIVILVILDLIIKGIIFFYLMDTKIILIEGWFGILPHINREQLSLFNLEFNLGVSTTALIVLNAVILIALLLVYYRIKQLGYMNRHIKMILTLLVSASICSIIDKISLGGSLDYILIKNWIIDLKDAYLFSAVIYLIVYLLANLSFDKNENYNDIKILKEFFGLYKKSN